ncbi:MAG: NAD(P)/FAD-dependent oxidoreductase [Clostridiales bacterium]|nr:NAD(P)/FAD-dependent oxidoreductase [Clostridiales bacterium]
MAEIIIAGAGHGGLTAAYNFARNGYSVTVYEKKQRSELGYGWKDSMSPSAFNFAGMPMPAKKVFSAGIPNSYYSPSAETKLLPQAPVNHSIYIERKDLYDILIENCESVGVKFNYGVNIRSATVSGDRVTGIMIEKDGEISEVKGDLVIDAAGTDSPVRSSLPASVGIRNSMEDNEIYYVYRAVFSRKTDESLDPPYGIFFYRYGRPGLDWIICEENSIDILVGKFGKMTMDEVEESIADFKQTYGFIGDDIISGGGPIYRIPVRKTLPLIVADGYALVGDSAAMAEPLSGSGITMSMKAGKMLADAFIEDYSEDFSAARLWKYQYRYFSEIGNRYLSQDIYRNALCQLTTEDIEYLIREKIITLKEIAGEGSYVVNDIIDKIKGIGGRRSVIPVFVKAGTAIAAASRAAKSMPRDYDKDKVTEWAALYGK